MKQYQVEITAVALNDMQDIYNYIANNLQAPNTAKNQYKRIADSILSLAYFPERYPLLMVNHSNISKLRKMNVGNYSIFYYIMENKVMVSNVLYSASDIRKRIESVFSTWC